MNKILIPKNPDETIILPPYVDFRDGGACVAPYVKMSYRTVFGVRLLESEVVASKQEGPK